MMALAACAQAMPVSASPDRRGGGRMMDVVPYIEAAQVLTAELDPGNDVVTYTQLAVGVDAQASGRSSAGSASIRYERRVGWTGDALNGDTVSGLARGSLAVVPQAVTLEAGGLATRTRVEGNGGTSPGGFGGDDRYTTQIYSVYAGPALRTRAEQVEIEGQYLLGYTRVEEPGALAFVPGTATVDYFDDSVTHSAMLRAGVRPGDVLPIGLGIGGGWNEQAISNFDQRIRDRHVRADVTVPVSRTVALVGGAGYEDVEISSRDALRDAEGTAIIGSDGRYVTDDAAPRRIAYQTEGLIWDAGVIWRPSRRTSLEAHYGRRYGSTTYYGSFSYAPDPRTSIALSVYDDMTGFGGALTNRLAGLPTQFDAFRNPFSGAIGGCVASVEGDGCLTGALGSIRSAAFRSRGIAGSYSITRGRSQMGIGAGYDRRRYIAAAGTVLEDADGVLDENIWLSAYASQRIDRESTLSANMMVNWFDSGFDSDGWTTGYSASLAYYRSFIGGLSGTAAVGMDGITRQDLPDTMSASALLGLRYSF